MKNWNQLFVRHGWMLTEKEKGVFDCSKETDENLDFLMESLDKADIPFTFSNGELVLPETSLSEERLLEVVDFKTRGRGEGLWFESGEERPRIRELDTYISGVVRQLNRLGFHTNGSCDGHERRPAHVLVKKDSGIEELNEIFHVLGYKRVNWRERRNHFCISLHVDKAELLNLAEKLSFIEKSWIDQGYEFIKKQFFLHQLEQLLMIPGKSGREEKVRNYVMEQLAPFVNHMTIDHAGNILAERTYKNGNGPTILLNAHLDIVDELEENRKILKDGSKWSSSRGILGADDRAGVAVLLDVAAYLHQSSSFNGKVKFVLTVKEECGLIGASEVSDYFLWNTDAAIVIDRRGEGDIVTSCGGFIPFCHPSYGSFFEGVAVDIGLKDWATTAGGSSDTRIWAQHGIQSVNLSAGYNNEHTEDEVLDVDACYQTAKLVKAIFSRGKELRLVLRDIRREERVTSLRRTV